MIAGVLALAWALPVAALGQACATDEDCKEGTVCRPVRCPTCDPDEGPCEPCPETGECVAEAGWDGESFWGTICESDADCPYAFPVRGGGDALRGRIGLHAVHVRVSPGRGVPPLRVPRVPRT